VMLTTWRHLIYLRAVSESEGSRVTCTAH